MSSPICADSSALANAVMGRLPVLRQELNDVFGQARIVFAPSLIHFEMVNTLWKYVRAGSIDNKRCREMLDAFLALPIRLVDDDDLHLTASDLANQLLGLSGYDAHFIAVARRIDSELWTVDKRLAAIGEAQGIPTRLWSA